MSGPRDVTIEDCIEVAMEIKVLDEYRKLLPRLLRPDSDERLFLSPLLDAIAIHTRALIDFFYGRPSGRSRHPDDLGASDFIDGWDRQLPEHLGDHVKLLDKHLAHITLRRSADRSSGTTIEVGRMADEVLNVATEFAENVSRWQITPGTWSVVERSGLGPDRS